jgi:hypothetical protein
MSTTATGEALLAACEAEPAVALNWLALADWLDEDAARAKDFCTPFWENKEYGWRCGALAVYWPALPFALRWMVRNRKWPRWTKRGWAWSPRGGRLAHRLDGPLFHPDDYVLFDHRGSGDCHGTARSIMAPLAILALNLKDIMHALHEPPR